MSWVLRMLEYFTYFLLGTWMYYEIRMLTRYRRWKTSDVFDLTSQENAELKKAQREASIAQRNLTKAQNKITSLRQKGKNLRRNKSGEYDNRSSLGKKLNSEIRNNQTREIRYQNDWLAAESLADDLLNIPSARAIPWIKTEAYRLSGRLTIMAFSALTALTLFFPFAHETWFSFFSIIFCVVFFYSVGAKLKNNFSKQLGI